ncbi:hypothetical protein CDD80_6368 [Ophiocordyceps camponoti-rufipedis]|uniref:Uncharacterized protein n=1 Tax=Ophiocordyceps camponoti-rufipedis TaxID=2004952 RepID=A0A2C5YMD4_9HYPO|nr:hypothetical protein CDD80_6368 [Ophiocordyceps camponoti-rufipedis]
MELPEESSLFVSDRSCSPTLPPEPDLDIDYCSPSTGEDKLGNLSTEETLFEDVQGLVQKYSDVLNRSESLAASRGSDLIKPRLVNGIDGFFKGPIVTTSFLETILARHVPSPKVIWLDVIRYAKRNPHKFLLKDQPDGRRCCKFFCKGLRVEIPECDWRLISSGALDGLCLDRSFAEDHETELATVNDVEEQVSEVIGKARDLLRSATVLRTKLLSRRKRIERSGKRNNPRFPAQRPEVRPFAPAKPWIKSSRSSVQRLSPDDTWEESSPSSSSTLGELPY